MKLRELYAKGLASSPEPIVIGVGSLPAVADLPRAVIEAIGVCLEALLYPDQPGAAALSDVASYHELEFGMVFSVGTTDLRLRRGLPDDSLELQLADPQGHFTTRARGREAVTQALTSKLARPAHDLFRYLHLGGGPSAVAPVQEPDPLGLPNDSFAEWLQPANLGVEVREQGDSSLPGNTSGPRLPNPLDALVPQAPARRSPEEIARLREEYEKALEAEALEDRINDLRRRLKDLEPSAPAVHDPVLESLRSELEASPAAEVTDEELAVLRDPEGRVQDFERRQAAMERSLEEVRERMRSSSSPWRSPSILAGLGLTVVCTLISVVGGPSLRAVALGNVAWLAGALMGFLQYLRARDEGRSGRQRVFALEEALEDLDEERRAFDRNLNTAKRRHGVQSYAQLEAMRAKRNELLAAEDRALEARRSQQETDTASGSVEQTRLEGDLSRLEAQRARLGDCPLASFQIAQELRQLGVSPERTRDVTPAGTIAAPVDSVSSVGSWTQREAPPPPLRELADQLGLTEAGGLEAGARRLWGRMLAALLNRKLESPNLAEDGSVSLSDDTGLVWATLTERERGLVAESAYLSLLLRGLGRTKAQPWPWVVRLDPFAVYGDREVDRLQRLYQRVAEHLQLVILDSGRRAGPAE